MTKRGRTDMRDNHQVCVTELYIDNEPVGTRKKCIYILLGEKCDLLWGKVIISPGG